MSTFFTDFSEYTAGSAPSDFTNRWAGTGFQALAVAGSDGGQVLSKIIGTVDERAIAWNDVDGLSADVEIVSKVKHIGGSSTAILIAVFVRGANTTATRDGYVAGFDVGAAVFRLQKFVAGVLTSLGTASHTMADGSWYWIRLRANGTAIKAKYWADGSGEPGTWNVEVTDSAVSAAGWQGAYTRRCNTGTARYWDNMGIGTAGDTAPTAPAASANSNFFGLF